jgi:phosphoribosylformimino-5-aminoimidazole carboxamide ribotide isomerase
VRVIPVLDLRGGIAVHARRGARETYRPVRSVLAPSPDPLELAAAFRDRLGLRELYVADLDAILGTGHNAPVIAELARTMRVLADAGTARADEARQMLALGVARVVVGSETASGPEGIRAIVETLGAERLTVSLDLWGRRVRWRSPDAPRDPVGIAAEMEWFGVEECIVLELDRVGTKSGVDVGYLGHLVGTAPRIRWLAGGGVRDLADLLALRSCGIAGALVATALHEGTLTRADLERLHEVSP